MNQLPDIRGVMLMRILIKLSVIVLIITGTGFNAFSAGKVTAEGMLTSVEIDGSVVIDEKGYQVDSSAKISDKEGKQVSLYELSVPARVSFKYVYAPEGFVIIILEEQPDIVPE